MYKNKKKFHFFAIIFIIIASTSSIFYFLKVEKEKNYIAIVEIAWKNNRSYFSRL